MAASLMKHLLKDGNKLFAFSQNIQKIAISNRSFSIQKCLASRFYTEKHEWVHIENGTGMVGISEHAQDQLGEIVYVELPEVGADFEAEDVAGCLESVKAASEIYSPVAGSVSEVNSKLEDHPGLVNADPLFAGWLFKLKVAADVKTTGLMDEDAYKKYVGSLDG